MDKKRIPQFLFRLFVICSACMLFIPYSNAEDDALTYRFAVVPQAPAKQIQEAWLPVINKISQSTGWRIRLILYPSIGEFEKALASGTPDFAYMNPYHLVMSRSTSHYTPLVRDDSTNLVGILVTKKTGDIKTLADLDGKNISFPSPNAFGASLYMRALLRAKEGIEFTSLYVKTHSNVYRNVIFGQSEAGGGVVRTLESEPASVRSQLSILYQTPGVRPHPIAAHPRVPTDQQHIFIKHFLELKKHSFKPLEKIKIPSPVLADYSRDYQSLESLNLEIFLQKSSVAK